MSSPEMPAADAAPEHVVAAKIADAVRIAWSTGDTAPFAAFAAADYARVAVDGSRTDLPGWRTMIESAREGFPDLNVEIEDTVYQPGAGKLAIRWRGDGSHLGHYLGVPPTHRRVSWEGATFFELAEGRVVRERGTWVPDQLLGALGIYFLSVD